MSGPNRYTAMQKAFYDEAGYTEEEIVGNYDFHENFPYETNILHLHGDVRKPVLPSPAEAIAFDVGCGEGRMIRRMSRFLRQVDGADLSEKMTAAARARCPAPTRIFLSTGADCGPAPSDTYDLVYNTISLHHICVYDLRAAILQDITRILKPAGCATLQFFFSKYYPFCRTTPPLRNAGYLADIHHRDALQAGWFENRWDAQGTNSACDAAFGTDQIPAVLDDFRRWFGTVDVWFHDLSIGRADPRFDGAAPVLPETHPNSHGLDFAWFTHMAFFHLRDPRKAAPAGDESPP